MQSMTANRQPVGDEIYEKLGLKGRVQLANWAQENRLL